MAKRIYCLACKEPVDIDAGKVPEMCPLCEATSDDLNGALWTTREPPRWTPNDMRFLKAIKIRPE